MKSSYNSEDVCLLLKDITGIVKPQSTEEREKLIQSGRHYCEMLPIEYVPTKRYMETYLEALHDYSEATAAAIGRLADQILAVRGKEVVLVSLARAGTPIGILLKRYLKWKYDVSVMHYSISIIRGRGIDDNAMQYILARHPAQQLLFVDGWIGKGAILRQLEAALKPYPGVSADLAVVADPAGITELCGTYEDILIPSSCLNSTVSGLISRTFLRDDVIGPSDFHGAVYYGELEAEDLSYAFIDEIVGHFRLEYPASDVTRPRRPGVEEVKELAAFFRIDDINLIKPGIGETTRVLLRRVPWKVLINESNRDDADLKHIIRLANEKQVPVEYYPLQNYKTCGIIKKMADT